MVRFCRIFIYMGVFFCLLTSCQENGDISQLYGQWALKTSVINGENMEHDNLYFSFQGQVVWAKSVSTVNHTFNDVFGSFSHVGDSIVMNFVQKSELTTPQSLIEEKFGFSDADNVRVRIKKMDSRELVLSEGENIWVFEKF